MIYLAYISLAFTTLQFSIALINLIFSQKVKKYSMDQRQLVSVLIPARNEEKNIASVLNCIHNLTYKTIEVFVFDDQSEDRTAEIVRKISAEDNRIRLIQSAGLEKGWLGKNFACYNLAQAASGKYLLFIDADVNIGNDIIEKTIFLMQKQNLTMLSIFPVQILKTFGEKITVPVMHYVLLSLLPLILIRTSTFASHSAANGQFILFDAEIYMKLQPHREFKNSAVEDIEISRFYKKRKYKIACLTGYEDVRCRMYQDYKNAVYGFTKNVLTFFSGSAFMAILFWIFTTMGFLPLLFVHPIFLYAYLLLYVLTIAFISIRAKQNIFENVIYTPFRAFALLHLIAKAIYSKRIKNYQWKGRDMY
jgi:glycosyltransferase involved in cell wall biosynthesis